MAQAPILPQMSVQAPTRPQEPAMPEHLASVEALNRATSQPQVTYVDLTDDIAAARAELTLKRREAAKSAPVPRPSLRGPPSHGG